MGNKMLYKHKNSAFKLSLLTSLVLSGHAIANDTQDDLPLEKIANWPKGMSVSNISWEAFLNNLLTHVKWCFVHKIYTFDERSGAQI